jgi:hypothetical protein
MQWWGTEIWFLHLGPEERDAEVTLQWLGAVYKKAGGVL